MDLILIRHPAVATASGICYGQSDVALAAPATAEVARLSARLAPLCAQRAVQLHSSPLMRCTQIARPLADHLAIPWQCDARLQEMHFGRWELQPWDAVPRAELDAWAADVEQACPHGGESVAMLAARLQSWLAALQATPGGQSAASQQADVTLVVTHAGVMRVLAALALRVPLSTSLDWQLDFGAVCHWRQRPGQGGWTLLSWNS